MNRLELHIYSSYRKKYCLNFSLWSSLFAGSMKTYFANISVKKSVKFTSFFRKNHDKTDFFMEFVIRDFFFIGASYKIFNHNPLVIVDVMFNHPD